MSPRWGTGCAKMLAILCVASSLVLVALGGSDPLMGFTFELGALADPMTIMGPILNMVAVLSQRIGCILRGVG
jgi:hypothetical protein